MSRIIQITTVHAGWEIRFDYDEALVSTIKALPAYARSYDPARKVWTILTADWVGLFAGRARTLGYELIGFDRPSPAPVAAVAADDWARLLFRAVGKERAKPVYRALSMALHPDQGGDTALFAALAKAYEKWAA